KTKKVVAGPASTADVLYATKAAKRLGVKPGNKDYVVFGVPKNTVVVSCGTDAVACPGVATTPTSTSWYLFKYNNPDDPNNPNPIPQLTGSDLKLSGTRADFDQTRGPIVLMQFTGKGSKKFQQITKGLYNRGNLLGAPQHFAIVLDRQIRSFPQIDPTDSSLSNGISGNAEITGLNSFQEAKNLALVLPTGSLPYNFQTLESTNVSATLGKDSLQEAKRAAIGGLIAVIIFLLIVYRFLGLIPVLGLPIYAAILYRANLLFHVTHTLPRLAGTILP